MTDGFLCQLFSFFESQGLDVLIRNQKSRLFARHARDEFISVRRCSVPAGDREASLSGRPNQTGCVA